MSDALSPITRTRLPEQLAERLRAYVREAGLTVGDRLPAERDIAARLGVSRVSVKQALLILEVQGAIATRQGGGSYLLREGAESPESVAQLAERRSRLPEALEARHALEVKFAQLAAVRRTEADLTVMEEALAAMAAEIEAGGLAEEPTRRFHEAVYAAAHNRVLAALMDQFAPYVTETRKESLRQPGRPARSLAEHRALLDAVRAGDPAAAVAAADTHMATIAEVRLLDWSPEEGVACPEPYLGEPGAYRP
ncbi:FadR/GntR family transcriptional regulator [Streptomyces sp. NPDC059740]|uniref:FadR/GntR family transcriptional regulator n=1 Tax=Streptomyces sp. NPDC059740 TaxID=3346926 RepID=UPI0036685B61